MNNPSQESMPARVRIKICGITRYEDAMNAVNFGADAIGFVFYEPSPRYVAPEVVVKIARKLPAFVSIVGLFVNAEPDYVDEVLNHVPLSVLQFHGDESEVDCTHYNRPYIKAVRVHENTDLHSACEEYSNAAALLLDTYVNGVQGGTGKTFEWSLIPRDLDKPIILAGGLNPDNVRQAINLVQPYAVDVSGGVEKEKGIKDISKISAFIQEVNNAK